MLLTFFFKVTEGVELIIPLLLKTPDLLDGVVWLLQNPKGLWGNIYHAETKNFIDNDLKLMPSYAKGSSENLDFELIEDEEWQKNLA